MVKYELKSTKFKRKQNMIYWRKQKLPFWYNLFFVCSFWLELFWVVPSLYNYKLLCVLCHLTVRTIMLKMYINNGIFETGNMAEFFSFFLVRYGIFVGCQRRWTFFVSEQWPWNSISVVIYLWFLIEFNENRKMMRENLRVNWNIIFESLMRIGAIYINN